MGKVTWDGNPTKVINNQTVKNDEIVVERGKTLTVGIHSNHATPSVSGKVFVRMEKDGQWFYSNSIANANLEAEDGETGKSGSCALVGGVYSFKLQVTTTQSETITAQYYTKV